MCIRDSTLREQPDALDEADRALIETLYGEGDPSAIYEATLADALKWAISYDALDENLPQLLGLWAVSYTHLDVYKRQAQSSFLKKE